MQKLFIIDAVNFLFRSYYAIGSMTNPKGESTGALYGFIRSMYKIIADFSPDFLVAVFDGPDNKKTRTAIYAEYKSHRAGMPEDLVPQLGKAIEWCCLAGIPNLSVPEVEADDTMGSIAKWAKKRGIEIYLCSSDKDLCQLVDDTTFLVHPHKDNLIVDAKKVKELYGVTPEQMIDYLAIVGDASDNIPGLEGFGPKTASALLEKFGTLDAILAHPEKVPGEKKQKIIEEGKEIALLSRKLATIHTEVDFPKEELFFHIKEPDLKKLTAFYYEMHFLSLLKELDAAAQKTASVSYTLIDDRSALETLMNDLMQESEICLDTETTDIRPMWAEMVGIGFAAAPGEAWYIPLNGKLHKREILHALAPLLEKKSFYGHNIKYDLHVLKNAGLPTPTICFDTMLASYLLNPQSQRHNLDALTLAHFQKAKIPIEELIGKGKNQTSMADVPIEKVAEYCCEDADYTLRLKGLFSKELEKEDLLPLINDIEIPLISVLARMEQRGIFVDLSMLSSMSKELSRKISVIQSEIYAMAEQEFNLNSPKQLSQILFEKMEIKPPKKTTTGFSTSADVLEELRDGAPIVGSILEYRSLEKLRSTYVDALPLCIHPKTGRVHCTFNQSVAATGRLSCQDPNLQNIPVRSEEGRKIREAFRPEKSTWKFLSADYSQIELRLLAHLSEDPVLLKAFKEGDDVHAHTASVVFDAPLKEVTPEMRQRAKAVNFGVLYGQQAFGLSQGLKIDFKEAAAFIDTYFKRYKKVKEYLEFCKESVRKTGKAFTLTGRQRPIPEIHNKNPVLKAAAERLAINTPLQGTAADLIKLAMIQIDSYLQKNEGLGYMLLQIHDELLFEAPEENMPTLSRKVKSVMEGVLQLKIPLEVHISIGKNWEEC